MNAALKKRQITALKGVTKCTTLEAFAVIAAALTPVLGELIGQPRPKRKKQVEKMMADKFMSSIENLMP